MSVTRLPPAEEAAAGRLWTNWDSSAAPSQSVGCAGFEKVSLQAAQCDRTAAADVNCIKNKQKNVSCCANLFVFIQS